MTKFPENAFVRTSHYQSCTVRPVFMNDQKLALFLKNLVKLNGVDFWILLKNHALRSHILKKWPFSHSLRCCCLQFWVPSLIIEATVWSNYSRIWTLELFWCIERNHMIDSPRSSLYLQGFGVPQLPADPTWILHLSVCQATDNRWHFDLP